MNKLNKFAKENGFNTVSKFTGGQTLLRFDVSGDFLGFASLSLGQNQQTHRFGFGSNEVDKLKCELFQSKFVSNQFVLQRDITNLSNDLKKLNQLRDELDLRDLMQDCKHCMLSSVVPPFFGKLSELELTQFEFNTLLYKIVLGQRVSEHDVNSVYVKTEFKTSQTDFWFSKLIEYLKNRH